MCGEGSGAGPACKTGEGGGGETLLLLLLLLLLLQVCVGRLLDAPYKRTQLYL